MFLSNAETCSRGEAFDRMVEQTGRALRDPQVVEAIGQSLATELLEVHGQLFLPDVRHGVACLPDSEKGKAAPALLPITTQEVPTIPTMMSQLMSSFIKHWPIGAMRTEGNATLASDAYGLVIGIEDVEFWVDNPPPYKEHNVESSSPLMVTNANFQLNEGRFSATRPVIVTQYETLFQYPDEIPPGVAHELVHARDTLQEAPLMVCQPHIIASEYCAYHVDHAVGVAVRQTRGAANALPGIVEAFRQEHASPEQPFAPTLEMTIKAYELKLL